MAQLRVRTQTLLVRNYWWHPSKKWYHYWEEWEKERELIKVRICADTCICYLTWKNSKGTSWWWGGYRNSTSRISVLHTSKQYLAMLSARKLSELIQAATHGHPRTQGRTGRVGDIPAFSLIFHQHIWSPGQITGTYLEKRSKGGFCEAYRFLWYIKIIKFWL